jgi:hypothetical protein
VRLIDSVGFALMRMPAAMLPMKQVHLSRGTRAKLQKYAAPSLGFNRTLTAESSAVPLRKLRTLI